MNQDYKNNSIRYREVIPIVFLLWLIATSVLIWFLLSERIEIFYLIPLTAAVALLGFFSGYLSLRVSKKMKYLEIQANQCTTFCQAIRKTARTLELQEILDSAAKIIVEITGVRGCTIKLLDPQSGKMKVRAIAGIEQEKINSAIDIAESMYQKGLMEGEAVLVRDIFLRDFPSVDEESESLICVPLRHEDKILGAVCIFGERGQKLSQDMILILSSLTDIVSLSISYSTVYENLKNLVKTKTDFLFKTSHELRSPLYAISSMAKTLLEGYMGELNAKQKEAVSRIAVRSQILADTVNDLLTLAKGRAEISTMKFTSVDLNRVIKETLRFLEMKIQEKNIRIELDTPTRELFLKGNEEGLRSIILNLIDNAIKYTPNGGSVFIRVYDDKRNIRMEVKDSGIGIPENERDNIFDEFFRASNAKTVSEKGTGLGLSIVRSTVEQHGGTIEVESQERKGTTFVVIFPKKS
ncbi:MAG: hypothetical protein DRP87_04075 [Spirochaetes bacterium]|nr:MAG: hypothetical protein DRP87_04075 [Spirochaetota bacterium]